MYEIMSKIPLKLVETTPFFLNAKISLIVINKKNIIFIRPPHKSPTFAVQWFRGLFRRIKKLFSEIK